MTGKAATAWDLSRRDVLDRLPVDRNRLFPDGKQDGLYLRVQNGVKSWVVRYRAGPVQRQKSLPLSQPTPRRATSRGSCAWRHDANGFGRRRAGRDGREAPEGAERAHP